MARKIILLTVNFNDNGGHNHPLLQMLRNEAKSCGWTTVPGIKEYIKETYGASLRTKNYYDYINIAFYDVDGYSRIMDNYKQLGHVPIPLQTRLF